MKITKAEIPTTKIATTNSISDTKKVEIQLIKVPEESEPLTFDTFAPMRKLPVNLWNFNK